MSDDYNNTPMGFNEFFRQWTEANKKPRPLWDRVLMWLAMDIRWRNTKWIYPSLHGISTQSSPNWNTDD